MQYMAHNHLVSMSDLKTGELGTVVELDGGHAFIGRMAALGFTPGATVGMLRNPGRGPIIVRVLDTQIALGHGQACKVSVRRAGHLQR